MRVGKKRKWKYLAVGSVILLVLGIMDYIRGQNTVQFVFSHFQACLLEYDQEIAAYQENGDMDCLESAKSAVQHVEHMDSGFLKFYSLSEPLFRKRRNTLSNYLRLLADYTEWLQSRADQGEDVTEQVKLLCEGNQEIEELLVEDSMDYDEIGMKTQKKVLDRIDEMTKQIRKVME